MALAERRRHALPDRAYRHGPAGNDPFRYGLPERDRSVPTAGCSRGPIRHARCRRVARRMGIDSIRRRRNGRAAAMKTETRRMTCDAIKSESAATRPGGDGYCPIRPHAVILSTLAHGRYTVMEYYPCTGPGPHAVMDIVHARLRAFRRSGVGPSALGRSRARTAKDIVNAQLTRAFQRAAWCRSRSFRTGRGHLLMDIVNAR